MKKIVTLIIVLTFTAFLWGNTGTHPRLLFNSSDYPDLISKVSGFECGQAYTVMKNNADNYLSTNVADLKADTYGGLFGRYYTKQILTLSLTGIIEQNSLYTNKAIDLIIACSNQVDVNSLASYGLLAVSDMLFGFSLGYDWLYNDMSSSERTLIENQLEAYGSWIYNNSFISNWGADSNDRKGWNWNGVGHGALGLAALTLNSHSHDWLPRAVTKSLDYLEHSVDDTGCADEGVMYLFYGLQHVVPFSYALERNMGQDLLSHYASTSKILDYLRGQIVPAGGSVVTINQCEEQPGGAAMMGLVNKFNDQPGKWSVIRLMGSEGNGEYGHHPWPGKITTVPFFIIWYDNNLTPLSPTSAGVDNDAYYNRGQVSLRDGWSDMSSLVTMISSQINPSGHNHYDKGSFTFHAFGDSLVTDPGPHMLESYHHSTILVNGTDTQPAVSCSITETHDTAVGYYAKADLTNAYSSQGASYAQRQLFFGKTSLPYVVIADNVDMSAAENDFDFVLTTDTSNSFYVNSLTKKLRITGSRNFTQCNVYTVCPTGYSYTQFSPSGEYEGNYKQTRINTTADDLYMANILIAVPDGQPSPLVSRDYYSHSQTIQFSVSFSDGSVDTISVTPQNISMTRNLNCPASDLNGDCFVDLSDLAIIMKEWGICTMPDQDGCLPQGL